MRKCSKCGELKDEILFNSKGSWNGKTYLRSYCIECEKIQARKYRETSEHYKWVHWASNASKKASPKVSGNELKKILGQPVGSICIVCGDQIESKKVASVDHLIPVSKGGTNSPENLNWAHVKCNQYKNHMTIDELVEMSPPGS
jgi:5-methylcytosine-specific restriction endonuclease McrA